MVWHLTAKKFRHFTPQKMWFDPDTRSFQTCFHGPAWCQWWLAMGPVIVTFKALRQLMELQAGKIIELMWVKPWKISPTHDWEW